MTMIIISINKLISVLNLLVLNLNKKIINNKNSFANYLMAKKNFF